MTIKVYSTSWCPYCHALMDWLDSIGVDYEEIDAEGLDIESVPCTEIDTIKIYGFDRPAILKALKNAEEADA